MRFRKPLKITSRTSSITNSFVQAIIPSFEPSKEEVLEALSILEIDPENLSCAYCGQRSTDWDHLRPLVRNKRPTGYINEIRNLVPSCGPCNQSKSGANWRDWMLGSANGSPNKKGIPDLAVRVARLEKFEAWGAVDPLPLRDLAGPEAWDHHWENRAEIETKMQEAQKHAETLNRTIHATLQRDKLH